MYISLKQVALFQSFATSELNVLWLVSAVGTLKSLDSFDWNKCKSNFQFCFSYTASPSFPPTSNQLLPVVNTSKNFYRGCLYLIVNKYLLSLFHGDNLVIFSADFVSPLLSEFTALRSNSVLTELKIQFKTVIDFNRVS